MFVGFVVGVCFGVGVLVLFCLFLCFGWCWVLVLCVMVGVEVLGVFMV